MQQPSGSSSTRTRRTGQTSSAKKRKRYVHVAPEGVVVGALDALGVQHRVLAGRQAHVLRCRRQTDMHLKRPLNQRASRDHEVWGELGRGKGSRYRAGGPAAGRGRTRSGGRRTVPWGRTMTTRRRMMTKRRRRRRGRRRGDGGRRRGEEAASGVTQPLGACVRNCAVRGRVGRLAGEWLRAVACRPPREETTSEGTGLNA